MQLKLNTMRLVVLFLILMLTSPAHADSKENTVMEVAENVYSFSVHGHYVSMFAITDDGVMVFETMNSAHATAMIEAIKSITDQPIKYAFHSHNHWDHASGGQVFLDAGATTIAHEKAFAWMKANPYKDMAVPKESWSGSRKYIELGGVKLEMHYLGMNHGLGMTVFILPQSKVAYIADIVTPNRIIFSVAPDFNPREWERSLTELLELNFDKAIFSHNENGKPLAAGGKREVELQLTYLQDLRNGFYAELKKGTHPMQIPKLLKLPKYKDWVGYDDWLEMNVWRILTDEFMGPFPWQPENTTQ